MNKFIKKHKFELLGAILFFGGITFLSIYNSYFGINIKNIPYKPTPHNNWIQTNNLPGFPNDPDYYYNFEIIHVNKNLDYFSGVGINNLNNADVNIAVGFNYKF